MVRLEKRAFAAVGRLYWKQPAFFPLIGAVLVGDQDGEVFIDASDSPRAFYVEHSFGFAQVFGEAGPGFQDDLHEHLVVKKLFRTPKVRLYTPIEPAFLCTADFDAVRSERQRFVLRGATPLSATASATKLCSLEAGDLTQLSPVLVDLTRFWRTPGDFLAHARAVVAWQGSEAAAICYAAAVADGRAEIDVATAPDFRCGGLGKAVVAAFVQICLSAGITPMWDCFTNNSGSMALARSCGFEPVGPAYPFYTISK